MGVSFNKSKITELIIKTRVDDLCLLLPHISRALGSYNRELKKQKVDKAARKQCVALLAARLFDTPVQTADANSDDEEI